MDNPLFTFPAEARAHAYEFNDGLVREIDRIFARETI